MLAGGVLGEAVEGKDSSMKSLWRLNTEFMMGYGRRNAMLDIFRIFLQLLENDDLNFGMAHRLVTEEDLTRAELERDGEMSLAEKVEKALRALRRPSLLRRLANVSKVMKRVGSLYDEYPEKPGELEAWTVRVGKEFSNFRKDVGL
jgi:hypothetical protein